MAAMARPGATGGRVGRGLRRAALVLAGLGVIALAYRATFVYELRPGRCAPGGDVAVLRQAPPQGAWPAVAAGPVERAVRVLSYNIAGHGALVDADYLQEIAAVIREQGADVVALQEVHRGSWQARFEDQAAELGRLTGMTAVFGASFGVLGGEFGNAVLSRGTLRDAQLVRLPSLGEPRSLLRAHLAVGATELDLLVTHLAAWGRLNRGIRVRQAQCLGEHAGVERRLLVLCGDLNAPPPSAELAALLRGRRLQLAGDPAEPTHPLLGHRIDYVFAGPGWRVARAVVVHAGPSDHWPVVADLVPDAAGDAAAGG